MAWNVVHHTKSAYQLSNAGTQSAYQVTIDAGDLLYRGDTGWDEFTAGNTEKLSVTRALGTASDSITVSWHYEPDGSDPAQTRKLLL